MITLCGQNFSESIVAQIRQTLEQEPEISRQQLSRRICQWLDWRGPGGRLKDQSCRKALVQLDQRGLIQLPPVERLYPFQKPAARRDLAPPPLAQVSCSLKELGAIQLLLVRGDTKRSRLWNAMMDAHHYLRRGPLCGDQLRYLVHSERHGWLGGLSFSACSLKVAARDQWIGWTEPAQKLNRHLLVNNSRFLIAPSVRVPHLASHVLGLVRRRLAGDWQQRYGYRPALLETYVERGRFAGTCYRAAGWLLLGVTRGRGRRGDGAAPKDIYLTPLEPRWPERMRRLADGTLAVRVVQKERPPRNWIEEELGGAQMGDARLTARLLQITGQFYERPLANIPQACGGAHQAKAAYRFLDNPSVQWQRILASHYQATRERLASQSVVLAVQDSTSLNHATHGATRDLGPLSNVTDRNQGLMMHSTMCFTPEGVPLGLLDVQCWARDPLEAGKRKQAHELPIEQKESYKWLLGFDAAQAAQAQLKTTQVVVMGDRESDIYELLDRQRKAGRRAPQLLIRAERGRNRSAVLAESDSEQQQELQENEQAYQELWDLLSRQPLLASEVLLVPPAEKRAARQATLELRAGQVEIKPPNRLKELQSVKLWAVRAHEPAPPEGAEPLEWLLLTTLETRKAEQARERLQWYGRRWGIETFHRILKSGCRAEARQLETAERLKNCLAIDLVVAWRIQYLTALGRQCPEVPCTVYFTKDEWQALFTFVHQTPTPPAEPPMLNEAVALLGRLGGHLGRAGDGEPGAEVLWRGMSRLSDIERAYSLYQAPPAPVKAKAPRQKK